MSSSKEVLLLSKLGKKKPLDTVDVIRGENDINTIDKVPSQDVASAEKMPSSKEVLKSQKVGIPGYFPSAKTLGEKPVHGSINELGDSAVPKTKKAYSPIKNYLQKGK